MVAIKDFEMPSCCSECQMASCKGLSGQFYCDITTYDVDIDAIERSVDCPLVEETSKVDMVAMLKDLQQEIKELKSYESVDGQDLAMLADIGILFQQKIGKLRGEQA